jgi:DNA-binding XRE family transcriptional regulator
MEKDFQKHLPDSSIFDKAEPIKDQFEQLRKNIAAVRHWMQMDKSEFTKHFGFRKAFTEVETGRFNPKIDELAAIAKATNLSIEQLMFSPLRLVVIDESIER